MKTLRFKVFGFAAMALLLAATVVSCGDDDEKTPPTENDWTDENDSYTEGSSFETITTFHGGEYANHARFFQKFMPNTDAKAEIKSVENTVTTIVYTSSIWGTFTFNNINVNNEDNKYRLSGEGTVEMSGMPSLPGVPSNPAHGNGEFTTYYATISAEVQNNRMVATIIASLGTMGDVEILFNPADFDEVYNNYNSGEVSDSTRQAR